MDPNRWKQVEELFHEAIALDPTDQEHYLDSQTEDAEILRQVREMLAADRETGNTIESVVGETAAAWLDKPEDRQPERAGPWRLVRPLGTGGMGTVYLAARDDDSYRQLAAVKLLKREVLAPDILERFRQERQILAELEHPNIARLLDGGALPDGRPYLVLEYVDGEPLTKHARDLTIRQRCELFAVVCDAVAHAHRSLIVHRDLKPANVLVDRRGNPKLLDFGIAKLIGVTPGHDTTSTTFFTPDYASPEQLLGTAITTATDVYALGMILFEILAGRPARTHRAPSLAGLVKEVTEGDPGVPGRVSAERIPADLDRIVAKAMSRDPHLRYGSADQLAADVRRYLSGLPVEARGASWLYVGAKFVQRNWLPVAAALILTVGLACSALWSREQAILAESARAESERQRDRAEKERSRAEAALAEANRQRLLAEENAAEASRQRQSVLEQWERGRTLTRTFLSEVDDGLKDVVGATKARQALVRSSLEFLENTSRVGVSDRKAIEDLATAYDRTADLQGYAGVPNLGNYDGAIKTYEKSLYWRQKLFPAPEAKLFAGYTFNKKATTLAHQGRTAEAQQAYENAARLLSNLGPGLRESYQQEVVLYRANLSRSRAEYAQNQGDYEQATRFMRESVEDITANLKKWPAHPGMRRSLANQHLTLARSLLMLHRNREALEMAERSLAETREVMGPKPRFGNNRAFFRLWF
jgi:tetratricopeptide (TPR) repeat protein